MAAVAAGVAGGVRRNLCPRIVGGLSPAHGDVPRLFWALSWARAIMQVAAPAETLMKSKYYDYVLTITFVSQYICHVIPYQSKHTILIVLYSGG